MPWCARFSPPARLARPDPRAVTAVPAAPTQVSQLLLLCLALQQSRSQTIRSTASATAMQFLSLLLELAATEPADATSGATSTPAAAPSPRGRSWTPTTGSRAAPMPDLAELSVASRCAFLAMQDLCLLADTEPATWLPGAGPVPVPFALEVIQRMLQNNGALLRGRAAFAFLLAERVCPLVLKAMRASAQHEWPTALRLCHLTGALIRGYSGPLVTECEVRYPRTAPAPRTARDPCPSLPVSGGCALRPWLLHSGVIIPMPRCSSARSRACSTATRRSGSARSSSRPSAT